MFKLERGFGHGEIRITITPWKNQTSKHHKPHNNSLSPTYLNKMKEKKKPDWKTRITVLVAGEQDALGRQRIGRLGSPKTSVLSVLGGLLEISCWERETRRRGKERDATEGERERQRQGFSEERARGRCVCLEGEREKNGSNPKKPCFDFFLFKKNNKWADMAVCHVSNFRFWPKISLAPIITQGFKCQHQHI